MSRYRFYNDTHQGSSAIVAFPTSVVRKLGLTPLVHPIYRSARDLQYKLAGETYDLEIAGARARFLIPTKNEWTDLTNIEERPILTHLISNLRPSDVFYDIGANIGLYACLVADTVSSPVIAFEAHPGNARRLEQNASLNDSDIVVIKRALAETNGQNVLNIRLDKIGSAGHTLVSNSDPDNNSIQVSTQRGDDFVAETEYPPPTVLKIDVGGAEYAVLTGLTDTLSRPECRLVYCELHSDRLAVQGHDVEDIHTLLTEHGFEVATQTVRSGKGETFFIGSK